MPGTVAGYTLKVKQLKWFLQCLIAVLYPDTVPGTLPKHLAAQRLLGHGMVLALSKQHITDRHREMLLSVCPQARPSVV